MFDYTEHLCDRSVGHISVISLAYIYDDKHLLFQYLDSEGQEREDERPVVRLSKQEYSEGMGVEKRQRSKG